jgi:YesN/AraC family two-component response regulator
VIIKSHGKLYLGNNVINFSDSNLFLFAPGLPHCFYNTHGYEKGEILAHAFVVFFKRDFLGSNFFDKTETMQLNRLITLGKKKNLEKLGEFILILNELAGRKCIELSTSIGELSTSGLSESKIVNDVFKYVAENFQKKISLGTAASIANMQKAAFCRYFKRKTKKKFSEFVNEIRIMHARKLLTETDEKVQEKYKAGMKHGN